MIENDTLVALKLLDSRMRQLLEVARVQAGRIVELRERMVKLQAAGAVNADGIAALGAKMLAAFELLDVRMRPLDELSNKNATLEDVLTANKEPAHGL